jgi:8-oxo-dGTP pyrophosphatase MutT (NUDIX family)
MAPKSSEPIRAAGGIIAGTGIHRGKIVVVRRRRYTGEVGLPKGKIKMGETEAEAAVREVEEETGLRASLRQMAGTTNYEVGGRPKTVTYFLMEAPEGAPAAPNDSDEIEAVEWLTPRDAVAALTHAEDRRLVSRIFNIGGYK